LIAGGAGLASLFVGKSFLIFPFSVASGVEFSSTQFMVFFKHAIFALFFSSALSLSGFGEDRPNIVMIMADDLGYECIGANGSEMYETPNIDALAAGGMRFVNAHAQPICTPSRVTLMTGIHNSRNYIKFGILDSKAITFGQVLKEAGYQTCIVGKWQLSGGMEAPVKFGFEKFSLWQLTRRPSRYPNPGLEIDGIEKDFKNGEFGPDLMTDYIDAYLENRDKEKPFFVYYPMIAPHWPFVPTPDSEDWDPTMWRDEKNEPGGFRTQKYWADDVKYTDKMVGKVVASLEGLGLREDTLVIFTGDNGTATEIVSQFNGKNYRGGKGNPKDGGTHVPFVANWPGTIEAGSVSEELVDLSDMFPTFVEASGAALPEKLNLDGVSLMPTLTGAGSREKDYIYCWYHRDGIRQKASQHVRDAKIKLYSDGRLFHVKKDPKEQNDLSKGELEASLASRVEELKIALTKHVKIAASADAPQTKLREGAKR